VKASLGIVGTKGTGGPGTAQSLIEYVFSGFATCPNGNAGFEFTLVPGTGHVVSRVDSTGDLLFAEHTSAILCFDPITLIQFFNGTEIIIGGTGKFAGATGSMTFTGTAMALSEDTAGNLFGPQSGEFSGTIITP
jgi:hypothetical protein